MAFVFEGLNLFPTYTVYDNIAFALRSPVYFELSDSATHQLDLNRPTFLLGFWPEDIKISLFPIAVRLRLEKVSTLLNICETNSDRIKLD